MTLGSFRRATTVPGNNGSARVITHATLGTRRAAVHVERGGPLYRAASLSRAAVRSGARPKPHREPAPPAARADAGTMLDSTADALLRALNRAYTRRPMLAIVLGGIFGLAMIEGLVLGASVSATLIFGAMALVAVVVIGRREIEHYTEGVEYVLDDHVAHAYRRLVAAFQRVKICGPVWHMGRRTAAGPRGGRRRLVVPTLALPPRVRSNIRVPALRAGRQTVYFFPDRLLVYEAQMAWGIAYRDLKVKAGDVRDVSDGTISDTREGNGFIAIGSDSGLSALFRCADAKAAVELGAAIEGLG